MNDHIYQKELQEWEKNAQHYKEERKFPYHKIIRQEIWQKSGLLKNQKLIDVGCGAAHFTHFLKEKTLSNIVGVDFSVGMIKAAKENYPDIDFLCSPVEKLPYKDASFDGVLAISLLHHLKAQNNLTSGVKEFYRVLKPEGFLYALDRQDSSLANLFEFIFAKAKLLLTPLMKNRAASGTLNEQAIDENDLKLISKCGFALVKQGFLSSLPFKVLGVVSNFLLYFFGEKTAIVFQKNTFKIASFSENNLNCKFLSVDRFLIFCKKNR